MLKRSGECHVYTGSPGHLHSTCACSESYLILPIAGSLGSLVLLTIEGSTIEAQDGSQGSNAQEIEAKIFGGGMANINFFVSSGKALSLIRLFSAAGRHSAEERGKKDFYLVW